MLHLAAYAIIFVSIGLAFRNAWERLQNLRMPDSDPDDLPALDTESLIGDVIRLRNGRPIVLHDFDPQNEALVLQLPEIDPAEAEDDDFVVRPACGGSGQDILFRGRLLVQLPFVPMDRRVDLYLEPLAI